MTTIQIHSYARHDRPLCLAVAHVADHHLAATGMLTDEAAAKLLPEALAAAPDWYDFDGLTLTYLAETGLPAMVEKWMWPSVAGYSGFTCVRLTTGAEIARFPGEAAHAVMVLHLE